MYAQISGRLFAQLVVESSKCYDFMCTDCVILFISNALFTLLSHISSITLKRSSHLRTHYVVREEFPMIIRRQLAVLNNLSE